MAEKSDQLGLVETPIFQPVVGKIAMNLYGKIAVLTANKLSPSNVLSGDFIPISFWEFLPQKLGSNDPILTKRFFKALGA